MALSTCIRELLMHKCTLRGVDGVRLSSQGVWVKSVKMLSFSLTSGIWSYEIQHYLEATDKLAA